MQLTDSKFVPVPELHGHDEHHHDHQTERRQQLLRAVILLGLALYFGYNILSGNLTNYVNERFAWLSYLAVLLAGIMGIASLMGLRHQAEHGEHDHGDHDHNHHDHSHEPIGWGVMLVVALPLLLGTLIPSKPLGADAVDGNITITPLTFGSAAVLTKEPLQRNVLDWLRVFSQSQNPADFNGDQAQVIGFVYREPSYPAGSFMVARFTVSCCVADASAIGLPVTVNNADRYQTGDWVQVSGSFESGEFAGKSVPILIADQIQPIDQPDHPYLYP